MLPAIPLLLYAKSLFSSVLANWRVLVILTSSFLLVGLIWYVGHIKSSLTAATIQSENLQNQLRDNAAHYEEMQKKWQTAIDEVISQRDRDAARRQAAQKREREILNVPKDQDGAVAPVLRTTLERLRNN